jgi:hypothetical protein
MAMKSGFQRASLALAAARPAGVLDATETTTTIAITHSITPSL